MEMFLSFRSNSSRVGLPIFARPRDVPYVHLTQLPSTRVSDAFCTSSVLSSRSRSVSWVPPGECRINSTLHGRIAPLLPKLWSVKGGRSKLLREVGSLLESISPSRRELKKGRKDFRCLGMVGLVEGDSDEGRRRERKGRLGLFWLEYAYVENILERRKDFRAMHLDHCLEFVGRKELLLGGAIGDPPYSAGILFLAQCEKYLREEFVKKDPYVRNNLVVSHSITRMSNLRGRNGVDILKCVNAGPGDVFHECLDQELHLFMRPTSAIPASSSRESTDETLSQQVEQIDQNIALVTASVKPENGSCRRNEKAINDASTFSEFLLTLERENKLLLGASLGDDSWVLLVRKMEEKYLEDARKAEDIVELGFSPWTVVVGSAISSLAC